MRLSADGMEGEDVGACPRHVGRADDSLLIGTGWGVDYALPGAANRNPRDVRLEVQVLLEALERGRPAFIYAKEEPNDDNRSVRVIERPKGPMVFCPTIP